MIKLIFFSFKPLLKDKEYEFYHNFVGFLKTNIIQLTSHNDLQHLR